MALKRTVCVKARLSSATRCQSALLHLLLLLLLLRPKPNHLHRIFSSIESIVDVTGLERSRYQKHVLEMIDVRNKFLTSPPRNAVNIRKNCQVVGKKPGLCHGAQLWVSVTHVYFATRKVTGAIRVVFRNLYWPLSKI